MQNRTTSSALPSTCLALAMLTMAMTLAPVAQAQDAATAAAKPRFDVLEYRVEGNTVLDSRVIERAIYGQLGPDKTIDDVNAARTALEQAYREAGFPTVFVDVPEQEVDQGMVRLAVTEGRVSSLKISGSRYFSNGWIREQLPEATPGTVPRIDAFQAQLRALNQRSADRMLTPVLRPGAEQGTVEVEVKVQDQLPVNGSVTVNNRNSADTTDSRIEAALRYDNLWQRDHSAGLQYQVSPEDRDETSVISASYVLRPKASDKAFAFYALSSDSDIATVGGGVDVIGKGEVYGARAILPLSGSDGLYHSLSLGVDYKDFDDTVGFDDEGEEDIVTPISYLNWSLGWNATLPREARTHTGDLTLNFGVRDLGNEVDEFANKRFKGRPNYYYLEGSYGLVQALPWLETSLALSLRGQLTTQALISNEQFAAGGIDTVRGYYEGEVLGDYGVQASLEWRSPDIAGKFWRPADTLYVFGFFDSARLLLNDPLPGEQNYTLLSAGVGLRMQAEPFTAGLDVAVPFRDALSTEEGDERLLFSLRYGF